jgi:hypothetical protein
MLVGCIGCPAGSQGNKGVVAILLVGLLVVVWAVVLVPSAVRRRREDRAADAVSSFHRLHRSLQRSQVRLGCARPALHRLRSGRTSVQVRRVGGAASGLVVLVRPDAPAETEGRRVVSAMPRREPPGRPSRSGGLDGDVVRRRRDVALGLVASAVVTAVLGILPPLRPLLVLTVVVVAALVGYVVLLARLRVADAASGARRRRPGSASRHAGTRGTTGRGRGGVPAEVLSEGMASQDRMEPEQARQLEPEPLAARVAAR